MARKANIAKEEIIEACWRLIETNTFPNIPRLSEYFKELDGRGCSNTTLLNAINDWEEDYREHQETELKDITEQLTPTFKRFERDVIQQLSVLLDEKIQANEHQLALKKDAIEGRDNSLADAYIRSEQQLEETQTLLDSVQQSEQDLLHQNQQITQRYEDTLSRTRVLESELDDNKRQLREADTKLNQAQVDLAKQDQQIKMLTETLKTTQQQLANLAHQTQSQHEQMLSNALAEIKELSKSLKPNKPDA
ncbi:hypothetical protein [Marinomonas gallaica]|uniref:hypothetical protein n=1 Tax=Marinomonas gallaica TaxID=1806667 RepID=UPI003A8D943C